MTVDKTSTLLGTYLFIVLVLANYCTLLEAKKSKNII
jgi:hypothetical protein